MAAKDDKTVTVIVCMDGSEFSNYAFDYYVKELNRPEHTTILCHCVELHSTVPMPMAGAAAVNIVTQMLEEQKHAAEEYFKKLTEKMKESKLHGKVKQCHGHPRSEILRVAEEEKASMIVVGSRGLGTIRRTLMGSVSDHLVHHSHVPVLIVKLPEEKH